MIHRVVDSVMDGIAGGATGLVNSVTGSIKGVGKSVVTGLDRPFEDLTGKKGPLNIADRAADGFLDAGVNFFNQGVVGSLKTAGKGVMRALDQPLEQIKGMNMGKMELPWRKR